MLDPSSSEKATTFAVDNSDAGDELGIHLTHRNQNTSHAAKNFVRLQAQKVWMVHQHNEDNDPELTKQMLTRCMPQFCTSAAFDAKNAHIDTRWNFRHLSVMDDAIQTFTASVSQSSNSYVESIALLDFLLDTIPQLLLVTSYHECRINLSQQSWSMVYLCSYPSICYHRIPISTETSVFACEHDHVF